MGVSSSSNGLYAEDQWDSADNGFIHMSVAMAARLEAGFECAEIISMARVVGVARKDDGCSGGWTNFEFRRRSTRNVTEATYRVSLRR